MVRTILALVMAAHGIGHILFLVALLGIADWEQSTRSWLLTGQTGARWLGSIVWIAALVGFCAAVYGLWDQQAWWRDAAVVAAIVSTSGLILFWVNPPSSSVVFALAFNLALLVSLLLLRWPSADTVGA